MLVEIDGQIETVFTVEEIARRYRTLRFAVPIAVGTSFIFGFALAAWLLR